MFLRAQKGSITLRFKNIFKSIFNEYIWCSILWTQKSNDHLKFVFPHQVLAELKKSNFTLLNRSIQFDENGDPTFGFHSILYWNNSGDAEEIGFYKFPPSFDFFINNTKIQWYTKGEVSCFLKSLCVDLNILCLGFPRFCRNVHVDDKVDLISNSCDLGKP